MFMTLARRVVCAMNRMVMLFMMLVMLIVLTVCVVFIMFNANYVYSGSAYYVHADGFAYYFYYAYYA